MRVLSLFSGYGGLDLGLQAVYPDARTVYVADVEEGPRRVLAHRFPDAIQLGDVTTVDWAALTPVDVIIGGSPCQDLSLAGRRAGMKQGTRSGLWESMAEAIRIMQPRLVVWENVKGALSAPAYSRMESDVGRVGGPANGPVLRALGRVVGDLTCLGYDCRWTTLSAASVGAPHLRERVFLVAHSTSYTGGGSSTESLNYLLSTLVATDSEGTATNSISRNTPPLRAISHYFPHLKPETGKESQVTDST